MAWTDSRVFTQFILNPMTRAMNNATAPTTYSSMTADVVKAALFNTTSTPDRDATLATTGYNSAASAWVVANEVTDATNWVAGGRQLLSTTYTTGTSFVMFDAADLSGGGNVTLSATFGCLVYDDTITGGTVVDQGACFNYFGGTQSVTAGTFTIVWHANGVMRLTN